MASKCFSGKVLASPMLLVLIASGTYGYMVHKRIKDTDPKRIQRFNHVPEKFRQSATMCNIVNTKSHQSVGDSRFISLTIPPEHQHLSDEVLLAKFAKGFFGGLVIGPERLVLQTLGINLVEFTKLQDTEPVVQLWRTKELSDMKLPPLHSKLFGTFQVLDVQLHPTENAPQKDYTESYVDFGFGSDKVGFAGAHRFLVVRSNEPSDSEQNTRVQIHYYSTSCNPKVNKPLRPGFMFAFHRFYGEMLFREGISEVLAAGCE